jgi:hypothetical protein
MTWRRPQLHAENSIVLTRSWRFALACALSAASAGVCCAVVTLTTRTITGTQLDVQSVLQMSVWAAIVLFPLQLVYGRIVSVTLMARDLFTWFFVVTAYVVPVALVALLLAGFPRVQWNLGAVAALLLSVLALGTTFWFVLRRTSQATAT